MKRTEQVPGDFGFQRAPRRSRKGTLTKVGLLGLGLSIFTLAGTAVSDVGDDCGGTETPLDAPLHTFCPGNVARAMDVNTNFRVVLAELDTKITSFVEEQFNISFQSDAELDSGASLVVGPVDGQNLAFDGNEILARNNGATASLFINGSGNESTTYIQGDAGRVIVGASGSQGTNVLTVRGDLRVAGAVDEECPTDMSPIGAWCIDDAMQGNSGDDFNDAVDVCDSRGAMVCPLEAIMMCDLQNLDSGSTDSCGDVTDDTASDPQLWTSTALPAQGAEAFNSMVVYNGENAAYQTPVNSTAQDGYFCCSFR